MAFHSLLIFIVLLNFTIGESIAARTNEELHWISVFPHTPMPKVLQDILPIPGRRMINNLEFGAYWDEENLDKESKTKNFPDNKGINDPESGVFGYDDSYGKLKVNDSPDNKGINDPEFGAYGYDDSYAKFKVNDSPDNKGINDPDSSYGYASYSSFKVKDNTERKFIKEDSPDNKGVNDPGFGDFGYQYTIPKNENNSDKKFNIEDSSASKGVNNPKTATAPYKKGVNDPGFGDFGYQYTTPKVEDNSNNESDIDDSPNSKGINDPEFGAYGYDDSYTAPNKKVNRKALRGQSRHENTATKETIYFFQETLLPGTKLNLPRLLQKSPMATFLPQQIAESLAPMSNDNLPQILHNFSLKAESKAAVYVEVAVKNCERDEMKGEAKYCATSLESFVDSGVSVLGKNIRLLWHELAEETKNPMFTIRRGVRRMGENNIVCHKMKYPYAVYLCHSIEKTEVYKVPLVSEDGTKANAMAACHKDTSAWSPNHMAFKILKVKPGSVPICHFFGRDTLVWIPN
ncbi:hypothetical protein HRI_005221400 [Hibiscus trionum]|uniref:BURP domain-containing protein n=1 Tax=Hibiscus trionum TaxID=183268 RepID=A0A9W7MVM5_HIBTR|nr:hypothetical protein HRI_005221400 [Hibiscus trionum]